MVTVGSACISGRELGVPIPWGCGRETRCILAPMAALSRPRVYFAGPDVFRHDGKEHLRQLAKQCDALGMEALMPVDGEPAIALADEAKARAVFDTNMVLLRQADGVVANLEPFRGTEPDSGTVFEVGAAVAMGLPVFAYGVSDMYANRVRRLLHVIHTNGVLRDPTNYIVEDFGLPLNLMLACSVTITDSAEEALAALAAKLDEFGTRPALN